MKKILFGVAALGLLGLAGAGIGLKAQDVVEAKAADPVYWYLRGSMNGWAGADEYRIVDGGDPLILDVSAGAEFKISKDKEAWVSEINTTRGDAFDHYTNTVGETWVRDIDAPGGTANMVANVANKYAFSIKDGALFVDFATYYYSGSDNSFGVGTDSDHPFVTLNDSPSVFNLTEDEEFKLRGRGDDNGWKYGCFGFGNLKDADFYGSFHGAGDGNAVCDIAGSYDVSVSMTNHEWTVRAVPHGVDPDDTDYIYVLDKYGNLLNTDHHAEIRDNDGRTTGKPGAPMVTYEGTTHMYKQEFWVGMEKINFNNSTTYTVEWDVSGVGSKAGKCLILNDDKDGSGAWNSNVWVAPETAKFIENYMHFQNFNESIRTDGTACQGVGGYYELAKTAYEAASFEDYREELCSLDYVVERLQAWAAANGKTFTVTAGVGSFSAQNTLAPSMNSTPVNGTVAAVVVTSLVVLGGIALVAHRRKEDR